jgi:acetyltransferase-like isoleucine patch superfamily enzyme
MGPPTPVDAYVRRHFLWLYVIIIWASLLPAIIAEVYFFGFFWPVHWLWMLTLLPWNLLVVYYATVVWATYVAKFFLWWDRRFHAPREGVFQRSPSDKDYRHFHLRNLLRKFPAWFLNISPFPWLKDGWLHQRFGAKIGKHCAIRDAILSPEFVEIGNNVIIGLGAVVQSYWYEQDRFIIGKVVIGNNAIIGSHTGLLPFTIIGEDAVVDSEAFVLPQSEVPAGTFVAGKPAVPVKMKDLPFTE